MQIVVLLGFIYRYFIIFMQKHRSVTLSFMFFNSSFIINILMLTVWMSNHPESMKIILNRNETELKLVFVGQKLII